MVTTGSTGGQQVSGGIHLSGMQGTPSLVALEKAADSMLAPSRRYPEFPAGKKRFDLSYEQRRAYEFSVLMYHLGVLNFKVAAAGIITEAYIDELRGLIATTQSSARQLQRVQDFLVTNLGISKTDCLLAASSIVSMFNSGYYAALSADLDGLAFSLQGMRDCELEKSKDGISAGRVNPDDIHSPSLDEIDAHDRQLLQAIALHGLASLEEKRRRNIPLKPGEFDGFYSLLRIVYEVTNLILQDTNHDSSASSLASMLFELLGEGQNIIVMGEQGAAEYSEFSLTPPEQLRRELVQIASHLCRISWDKYGSVVSMSEEDWQIIVCRGILRVSGADFYENLKSLDDMPRKSQAEKSTYDSSVAKMSRTTACTLISILCYVNQTFLMNLFDAYLDGKLHSSINPDIKRLTEIVVKMSKHKMILEPEQGVSGAVRRLLSKDLISRAERIANI